MDGKKNKIRENISENNAVVVRRSLRNKSKITDVDCLTNSVVKKEKVNTHETKHNNIKLRTCKVKLHRLKLTENNKTNPEQKSFEYLLSNDEKRNKFFISRKGKENLKPSKNLADKNNKSKSKQSNDDDIYEFLTQASYSQSNNEDPNKDIIEKLVNEGKASLIKHMVKNKKKKVIKRKAKIPAKKLDLKEKLPLKPKSTMVEESTSRLKKQIKLQPKCHSNVTKNKDDSLLLKENRENEPNKSQVQKLKPNKEFLEMVKKIVESTPSGKKPLLHRDSPNISPIAFGDKSPWRLPERFNFSRAPQIFHDISFSCLNKSTQNKKNSLLDNTRNALSTKTNRKSFESKVYNENINLHSKIFENYDSFKKENSPRIYRSPLKQINIMNVINLPPLTETNINGNPESQSSPGKDISTLNEMSENNKKMDNLFGFEEYLTEDEYNIKSSHNSSNNLPSKRDLRKKLKRLRYALPKNPTGTNLNELKSSKKYLGWEKQTDIRELISSTKNRNLENKNFHNLTNSDSQTIDLFKDTGQGETTLNFSEKRRTYSKNLGGRKEKDNIISYEPESYDEMEDDEHKHKNIKKKTEKRKKETKQNEELESFAAEFNSMCEEVKI